MDDPAEQSARSPLLSRVRRRLAATGTIANVVGAVVVFGYVVVLSPHSRTKGHFGELVGVFAIFMAVVVPVGQLIVARVTRPLWRAVREGRPLVGRARRLLFTSPAGIALFSFAGWCLAGAAAAGYDLWRIGDSASGTARIGLSVVLAGLTTTPWP